MTTYDPNNREAFFAALRSDLSTFTQRAFREIEQAEPYLHNWHIDAMAHQLTRCAEGEIRRLIITLPPRHLKSMTASVAYSAWVLGHDPTLKIIAVSYNDVLATKFSRDVARVMLSDWYRYTFPGTRLTKATDALIETTVQGGRFATSIGGTLTGMGANLIIIDDPIKAGDAMSEAERNRVNAYYREALYSRLNNPRRDAIILVMQRLHAYDLAGTLLATGAFEHLDLPAIAQKSEQIPLGQGRMLLREVGDILHPARLPREELEITRRSMSSRTFAAQYLQRPDAPDGALVQRSWLHRYERALRPYQYNVIIQSWDIASSLSETADYSVGMTFGLTREHVDLLDVVRTRLEIPDLRRLILSERRRYSAQQVLIENQGCGIGLLQDLRRDNRRWARAFLPRLDKVARLEGVTALIENGTLRLPTEAPWLDLFLEELLAFPRGRNDDQVDALSQFLTWYVSGGHWITRDFYAPDGTRFGSYEARRAYLGPLDDEDDPPPPPAPRRPDRTTWYQRNRNGPWIF